MAEQALFASADSGNDLGVRVPISEDLALRLRQHQPQIPLEQPKLEFLSKKSANNPDSDDDDEVDAEDEGKPLDPLLGPDADPLDNWNEVLPAADLVGTNEEKVPEEEHQREEKEDEEPNNKNEESDNEWSVTADPPPHMPVVVVNLQRLVGYIPQGETEKEQLEHQIHAALWYGSAEAAQSKQEGNPQEDNQNNTEQVVETAQHFDERVTELMQSGVAQHSTSSQPPQDHQIVVAYPEFLCQPRDSAAEDENFAPRTVLATTRIWKRLLKPHPIPVVASLLQHLQDCHRSLVWKYQMNHELVTLAKSEEKARIRRHQSKALREWKTGKREHQLDQLYQVRETLEHRLEMAVAKVRELEGVRDQAVALEIRRRRAENVGVGGLAALDLNSTILAFPEASSWLGLEEEEEDGDYDDQIGPSFVSDNDDYQSDGSGYDAEGDVEDDDDASQPEPATSTTSETEPAISSFPKRDNKARRAKVAKKRRHRLEEAAKEAEHQSKLDAARAEEIKVRELCTTTDLRMAQAIRAALEKKMASVDELLENLQEEAWADEEAQEKGEELVPGEEKQLDAKNTKEPEFGLLDQVLAMILGSFPPPTPAKDQDAAKVLEKHTLKLQAEHSKIVKEWKDHFGRLPQSLLGPETAEEAEPEMDPDRQTELRTAYGIDENEKDDWEADSDDEKPPNAGLDTAAVGNEGAPAPAPAPTPPPQRTGLRPGGKPRR